MPNSACSSRFDFAPDSPLKGEVDQEGSRGSSELEIERLGETDEFKLELLRLADAAPADAGHDLRRIAFRGRG